MSLSEEKRTLFKIKRLFKEAVDRYRLIEEQDKIVVGLSGGKDSLALLELLGERKRILKPVFEVEAAYIRIANISYESDEQYMRAMCERWQIPFTVLETSFDASTDSRKSPCFLCSWNRRKQLFLFAKERGCNKIALGHHQDDILETLLMNMTFQGAMGTMPPLLKMNKFDMTIIRPMCLIPEKMLTEMARIHDYRPQIKHCPYENDSHRHSMKEVVRLLESMNSQVRSSLWASMSNIQNEYLPPKL